MQELRVPQVNFDELKVRVDKFLLDQINKMHDVPPKLHDAIKYVVLSGGKRVRPLLVYSVGLALDANIDDLDRPAAAIELIHAYSLTHDDLPAMDDDELRRGKPTCHRAYDEATAILVGDVLQCLAFELLAQTYPTNLSDTKRLKIINYLSKASGAEGMAGGQSLDLSATGKSVLLQDVEKIHTLKTGKLISACIMMGALCTDASTNVLTTLETFANKIGLAYQIHDDILDIESSTETLGKKQGADVSLRKATYPSVVGLEESKKIRDWMSQKAASLLKTLDYNMENLERLVDMMIHRES